MKSSDELINAIKSFEGCELKAYKCPAGVWTIGYGHTLGVKQGQKITQEIAVQLLREDLVRYEKAVQNLGVPKLTQAKFDALVDFAYNAGYANLRNSTFLKLIKSGAPEAQIRSAWMQWVKATDPKTKKKITLPGLVKRRQWECDMFFHI